MSAASVIPIRRKRRPVGGVKACVGPCERTLPLEDFHRRAAATDGRQSRCKACDALRSSKEHTAARAPRISRGQVERDAKPSTVVEVPPGARPAELDDASKRLLMRVRRVYSRRLYERGLMVAPKRFSDDEDEAAEPEAPVDERGNAEDDDPTRVKGRGSSWTVDDQAEVEAWASELAIRLRAGEGLRAALGLPAGRAISNGELERMGIRDEDSGAEGGVDTAGAAPPAPVSASPSPDEREGGTRMSKAPAGSRIEGVLTALRAHGALAVRDIAQHTGINVEHLGGLLWRLRGKGLVAKVGDGRWGLADASAVPVEPKSASHTGGGGATPKRAKAPKVAAPRAAVAPSDDPLVADLRARLAVLDRRRQKIVDLLEDLGAAP